MGKIFLIFLGACAIALPIVIFQAFSVNSGDTPVRVNNVKAVDFDHNAKQLFDAYKNTTSVYMSAASTSRTLNYYYSLRQYPGSPPFIPHDLTDGKGDRFLCLSCHEKGGFVQSMNRFTPVTPHPGQVSCRQCHVKTIVETLFRENDWVGFQAPKLGRSELPGSPPPIAHSLQMRENCVACHVGPGTVVPIRVEHPMRGNCRQCHVPRETNSVFTRDPEL